jgi:hypothetical protein
MDFYKLKQQILKVVDIYYYYFWIGSGGKFALFCKITKMDHLDT